MNKRPILAVVKFEYYFDKSSLVNRVLSNLRVSTLWIIYPRKDDFAPRSAAPFRIGLNILKYIWDRVTFYVLLLTKRNFRQHRTQNFVFHCLINEKYIL